MAQVQLQNLSHRHHAIIDCLLAELPNKDWAARVCRRFGITRSWLSIIMHSDVFMEEFSRRRGAYNDRLNQEVIAKQFRLLLKSLDKLNDIVEDKDTEDRLVHDIANAQLKALGFGSHGGTAPVVERTREIERRSVDGDVVERARETYRNFVSDATPA